MWTNRCTQPHDVKRYQFHLGFGNHSSVVYRPTYYSIATSLINVSLKLFLKSPSHHLTGDVVKIHPEMRGMSIELLSIYPVKSRAGYKQKHLKPIEALMLQREGTLLIFAFTTACSGGFHASYRHSL